MGRPASYKKSDLRDYYKRLRNALPAAKARQMDQQILQQFKKIPIRTAGYTTAFIYKPMTQFREVGTERLMEYLQNGINPGLQIAFPKTHLKTLEMQAIIPNPAGGFSDNKWRLSEPDEGQTIPPELVDIVLLPLLIFDLDGHRVGYGKGFYDRFLAKCRPNVLKIGLSYLEPIPKIEDVHPFDIPLDFCVTPDRLYDFRKH